MTTRRFTYILLVTGCLSSIATAEKFPFADGTFDENNKLVKWTLDEVRKYCDDTIGKLTNDDGTPKSGPEKDAAADPRKLNGYPSPEVESKTFTTLLDLTDATGPIYVCIHVDDLAFLTATELDETGKPIGVPITYDLKGSALWRAEKSYAEFPNPIPGGKKYSLKLDYTNTVNLTKQYNGLIDYDGVNVFLHQSGVKLDLEIADGQTGNILTSTEEDNPGAFTVANKNDTDGDGTIDNLDDEVTGEVDLMRMVINPPIPNNDPELIVTLTKPVSAKLYKASDKKGGEVSETTWKAKNLPLTYWVEMQTESSAIMSDAFTLSASNTIRDNVNATAIWVEKTDFHNKTEENLWKDCDDPAKNTFAEVMYGKFGPYSVAPTPDKGGAIGRNCGFEFVTKPSGLSSQTKVKFDCTRQKKARVWTTVGNDTELYQKIDRSEDPGPIDTPNDESIKKLDNDNIPDHNNHIYSLDFPGLEYTIPQTRYLIKANFLEYVRVSFNGSAPPEEDGKSWGSRCSVKEPWFALTDVEKDGDVYKFRPDSALELGEIKDIENK